MTMVTRERVEAAYRALGSGVRARILEYYAEDLRWLSPLPWLLAGAGGLVAATVSSASRRDRWCD